MKKIDWNNVDVIICGSDSHFSDDKKGECDVCKNNIVFRPYQPCDVPKICLDPKCIKKFAKVIKK